MNPPRLHRWRADDDEGATLVIIALALIALFGMVVLVVDVGGLLWKRREMVNGSDAAALAAAKTCAVSFEDDGVDPETRADTWAIQNVRDLQGDQGGIIAGGETCRGPNGYVTVEYTNPQSLFFAPVLGFGNEGDVTTRATAIWGPVGAANPVPIVVYANAFNDCRIDADPTPGDQCYIWEDNDNTAGNSSAFGWLDLRTGNPSQGWDSSPGASCPDPGNGINGVKGWLERYPDANVGDLSVNYPDPTYVCRASGNRQTSWDALEDLRGQILFFPINRCDHVLPGEPFGQINSGGGEVACGTTPHQYDIIGFVALRLIEVYTPNEVRPTVEQCGPARRTFAAASPLSLDTFGIVEGCFTSPPDQILSSTTSDASPTVAAVSGPRPRRGPDGTTCTGTNDWCYDPANRQIIWNPAGPAADNAQYDVSFRYQNGGVCGFPPSVNNSGHCIVVEMVDVQIGGSGPGGGDPNSNLRAIALCNPEIAGSCDPIAVP